VNQFTVTVQKTEASTRCELQGTYVLIPGKDSLILKDPRTKQDVYKWPYNYLRRYGIDQVNFTFEAGRRCDSGQGLFVFETKAVKEIFHIIDAAVKEKESKKKQQRLSLTSVSSEASTASSRQLLSVASLGQESSDEKSSSGGRVLPTKGTDSNRKVKKRKENRDRKGNTSPSGAKGAERNLPATNDREGVGEVVYATVKYPEGKPTKVNVEESTVNPTTYRDSYSDDSFIDPVYENVSDIESLLSFEEEPSFLKDIQKSTCENSPSSFEDQNIPSPTGSIPDYENIAVERNQLISEGDHGEGSAAREEAELHQTSPGAKHKERDASLSSGASKATKAKFPAGIQEVLTDLYSKELSKAREGKLEKIGRSSELQRKY
ncbi:docking protein 1-like, partial [Rhincodon typus]|uniref:docking protein 1-like n=1 Tax=Rhincodon typus TaxID=259920 RepID=UPI00202EBF76